MNSHIFLFALFLVPTLAAAQTVPATYPHSGLAATAALTRLERDGLRYAAPRSEALGYRASPASSPRFLRYKPVFRYSTADGDFPDVQEMLFFGETRAVRIRLHLKIAGEPMGKAWSKQIRRYFDFLDRDGDGLLNAYEAEFVFSNRAVQQLLQSGNAYINPNEKGRSFADFDRDGDGKISFDEFLAYYAPSSQKILGVSPSNNRDENADFMTNEFFKILDRDKDGKLSKTELAEAEKLIPLLDQNEDECLSAIEIVPNLFNRPQPTSGSKKDVPPALAPSDRSLHFYKPGTVPESIVESLLRYYDKDKNLRLTKAESGFDDATFTRLDTDGDGELSIPELMAWKDLPPDLDLELTYAKEQTNCTVKLLAGPDGKPTPLAGSLKIIDEKTIVRVGKQQIDIASQAGYELPYLKPSQSTLDLFETASIKKQDSITERELVGPQNQLLRILFDVVDRDGDGKMTKKELDDYIEMQRAFMMLPMSVTYKTQTPSLFVLLDTNDDGRLSVRELRNAWNRLKDLEPGGGEFITRAALQPQVVIRYTTGVSAAVRKGTSSYALVLQYKSNGPLWFSKMDLNGDGDVSRTEFPGSPADFDKIDLDHDGLISLEEAEIADKRYRAGKK